MTRGNVARALALVPLLAAAVAACGSTDSVAGCWQVVDGDRSVSFFLDGDGSVVGTDVIDGETTIRTEVEGRWKDDGGGPQIDASCKSREPGGCEGVPGWSMQCTLEGEDRLACSGAPFAAETMLSECQGSATVPGP